MDVKDGTAKDNDNDHDNDDDNDDDDDDDDDDDNDDNDDDTHTIGNKCYVVKFLGHAGARGRHDPCGGSPLLQPLRFRGRRRIYQPTNLGLRQMYLDRVCG